MDNKAQSKKEMWCFDSVHSFSLFLLPAVGLHSLKNNVPEFHMSQTSPLATVCNSLNHSLSLKDWKHLLFLSWNRLGRSLDFVGSPEAFRNLVPIIKSSGLEN